MSMQAAQAGKGSKKLHAPQGFPPQGSRDVAGWTGADLWFSRWLDDRARKNFAVNVQGIMYNVSSIEITPGGDFLPMPTILIADDSPFFLNVYKSFLRQSGATILEARNAEGAKNLIRQKKPDLVYMAYDLPDQTGADCCKFIKDHPELSSIPVILICDDETSPQLQECRAAGCDSLLVKPLVRTTFVDVGKVLITGIREVRRSCRVSVRVSIQCINRPENFTARGLDISRGGIFIESGEPVELNEKLQLSIQLCRPGEDGEWFECSGEVAWCNRREKIVKPSHPVGFGVRFLKMSFTETERLHGYLKKLDGNK